jgi:hypothetical protein
MLKKMQYCNQEQSEASHLETRKVSDGDCEQKISETSNLQRVSEEVLSMVDTVHCICGRLEVYSGTHGWWRVGNASQQKKMYPTPPHQQERH